MFITELTYPGATRVLVWRLDEEAPLLLALCREAGIPVGDLLELPVKRQREKAAELLLLCRALGRPAAMCHDGQGAPSVVDGTVNISITHTMGMVALAVNGRQTIGLDAERADRRQVLRVRDKFLNDSEQRFIAPDDLCAHVMAWTAKEAIIKAERNSALDWTHGISLTPFDIHPGMTTLQASCGGNRYCLSSRLVEGHFITVAAPV